MSFARSLVIFSAVLLCPMAPAQGQQVETGGLGQIDPWGAGYISSSEGAFSSDLWSGSRTDDVLGLMRRTALGTPGRQMMTPVEHDLLRRVLLSPGERPIGESDDLVAERIRLLGAIGETEAARDLMKKSGDRDLVLAARELEDDLALAQGQTRTACARAEANPSEEAYSFKLRAVCYALSGDSQAAELTLEFAEDAGVDDRWLFDAVSAASVETEAKPAARLSSGLEITASLAADLTATSSTMASVPSEIALAIARREELPPEWRRMAAAIAVETGAGEPDTLRGVFADLARGEDYTPKTSLERAMVELTTRTGTPAERANAYASALGSASGRPERFAQLSQLLAPGIEDLPRSSETAPRALTFARAEIARGELEAANRWIGTTNVEGGPRVDAFDVAMLRGIVLLAEDDPSASARKSVIEGILEEAKSQSERAEAARLLTLWNAIGRPLPPAARDLIRKSTSDEGRAIDTGDLLEIEALSTEDTAAELVLRLVKMSSGNPERLTTSDAARLTRLLVRAGMDDDARRFATEALAYWRG